MQASHFSFPVWRAVTDLAPANHTRRVASPLRCNLPVPGRAANACNTFGLAMNHDQGCFGLWMLDAASQMETRNPRSEMALWKRKGKKGEVVPDTNSLPCCLQQSRYHDVLCIVPGTRISSYSPARHFLHCTTTALREQPPDDSTRLVGRNAKVRLHLHHAFHARHRPASKARAKK